MTPESNFQQIATIIGWIIGTLGALVLTFGSAWMHSITRSLSELKKMNADTSTALNAKIDKLIEQDSHLATIQAEQGIRIKNLEREVFRGNKVES